LRIFSPEDDLRPGFESDLVLDLRARLEPLLAI